GCRVKLFVQDGELSRRLGHLVRLVLNAHEDRVGTTLLHLGNLHRNCSQGDYLDRLQSVGYAVFVRDLLSKIRVLGATVTRNGESTQVFEVNNLVGIVRPDHEGCVRLEIVDEGEAGCAALVRGKNGREHHV